MVAWGFFLAKVRYLVLIQIYYEICHCHPNMEGWPRNDLKPKGGRGGTRGGRGGTRGGRDGTRGGVKYGVGLWSSLTLLPRFKPQRGFSCDVQHGEAAPI